MLLFDSAPPAFKISSCLQPVRLVHEVEHRPANQFLCCVSQHIRQVLIHISRAGLRIDHPYGFLSCFDNLTNALIAFFQCFFGAFVLSAVVSDRQRRRIPVKLDEGGVRINPPCLAAPGQDLEFGPGRNRFAELPCLQAFFH